MTVNRKIYSRLQKYYTVWYNTQVTLTESTTVKRQYRTKEQAIEDCKELANNILTNRIWVTDSDGHRKDIMVMPRSPEDEETRTELIMNGVTCQLLQALRLEKLPERTRANIAAAEENGTEAERKAVWSWVDEHGARPELSDFSPKYHAAVRYVQKKIDEERKRKQC